MSQSENSSGEGRAVAHFEQEAEKWQRERAASKQAEHDDRASGKIGPNDHYGDTWNYYEGLAVAFERAARYLRENPAAIPVSRGGGVGEALILSDEGIAGLLEVTSTDDDGARMESFKRRVWDAADDFRGRPIELILRPATPLPEPSGETYTREQLESGEFIEAVLWSLEKIGWEISLSDGTEGFAQDARPAFIDALDAIDKGKGGPSGERGAVDG